MKFKNLSKNLFISFSTLGFLFSCLCCSKTNKTESYGVYKGYELIYEKDNDLTGYNCETLFNLKFCYEKGYRLKFRSASTTMNFKRGVMDLLVTPAELPSIFESYDSKHPRNYKKDYIELGTPMSLPDKEVTAFIDYSRDDDIEYIYFHPQRWFSFHRFTNEELGLDKYGVEIEYTTFDGYYNLYANLSGVPIENQENQTMGYWCSYHINTSKLSKT